MKLTFIKILLFTFGTISIIFSFENCIKEVSLTDAFEKKIVVEGIILPNEHPFIKISETVPISEENDFPVVNNALVELIDGQGNIEKLISIGGGAYSSNNVVGIPGNTYTIEIKTPVEELLGRSSLPTEWFKLDSLKYEENSNGSSARLFFKDLPNREEFGIINIFLNNENLNQGRLFSDEENDGEQHVFIWEFESGFSTEDSLKIEYLHLEKWLQDYFLEIGINPSLPTIGGFLISSPPGVHGNLEPNGLGYFGAVVLDSIKIIL